MDGSCSRPPSRRSSSRQPVRRERTRESALGAARSPAMATDPEAEAGSLDAYSAIVTYVAARLTPRVAALRIRMARDQSGGSAVVLTGEGHLVTNSHVVGGAAGAGPDGTVARFDVVGRDALSDLAVVRTDREVPIHRSSARPARSSWAPWWSLSATPGPGRNSDRGVVTPWDGACRRATHGGTVDRGRHPDRRRAQPRQLRRRPGRQPRARGRHQHGGGRHRTGARRTDERHDRRIIHALMHDGRVRRAYLGLVSAPAPLTPIQAERFGQTARSASSRPWRTARPRSAGSSRRSRPGRRRRAARRRPVVAEATVRRGDRAADGDHRAAQRRPGRRGRSTHRAGRLTAGPLPETGTRSSLGT